MSSLNVNPEFNTEMEQLTPETRAHADRFNERYGQLLGNDAFLKESLKMRIQILREQWLLLKANLPDMYLIHIQN